LNMEMELEGKAVIVTGSSRGIGKATAAAFLAEGAKVILTGRDEKSLEKTRKELSAKHGKGQVYSFQGDMSDQKTAQKCSEYVEKELGKLDVLVSNIGSGKTKPGLEADTSEWQRMIELNLMSSVAAVNAFVPLIKKNNEGSIVFISSIAGLETLGAPLPYSAAKAAVIALSKNLSVLLAKDNIRVNTIAPGNIFFAGGRWEEIVKEKPGIIEEYIKKQVPMKRFGKPEEVADAAVFLASPRASFITGACLTVDGGETRAIM
jgi:3-oxoacyl-[acyl-carrier protein] reductase